MQNAVLNKAAVAGLVATVLGGSALVGAATVQAADLPPYVTDEEALLERPPVQRQIVVEENFSVPPIGHHMIERRIVEHRITEGYEGPALVLPQYLPMVSVQESESYEGPALVPPQYVPIVPMQ